MLFNEVYAQVYRCCAKMEGKLANGKAFLACLDERELAPETAKIVATDPQSDIAVGKMDNRKLSSRC